MARVGIREYDCKKMFSKFCEENYFGYLVEKNEDLENIPEGSYVMKPDMLFGKRGKYGLIGLNLDKSGLEKYFQTFFNKKQKIGEVEGALTTFVVEKMTPHKEEYYISIKSERDYIEVYFSNDGGVEVEENWDKVKTIKILTGEELSDEDICELICGTNTSPQSPSPSSPLKGEDRDEVTAFIKKLYSFFIEYGFVYLEVNPFCFDENTGDLVCLDMVGKLDDCEFFRQKHNWGELKIPSEFGSTYNDSEKKIKELDEQTGASLKFKILNPNARIWTLLSGGGGSLVITDTLGALGFSKDIGNYGELSGDPSREFSMLYTKYMFTEFFRSDAKNKVLVIGGAIANFTDVSKTFDGLIEGIELFKNKFIEEKVQILVRRGGINDNVGLKKLSDYGKKNGLNIKVYNSDDYMTEFLKEIK